MPIVRKAQKDPFRAGGSSHQKADMSGWGRVDRETKNNGGSWFAIGSPGQKGDGQEIRSMERCGRA